MPLVQILMWREVKDGQQRLARLLEEAARLPVPQTGIGRLHVEGITVGENPFPLEMRRLFNGWGYHLDSLNWIYAKKFADDETALDEMTRLDGWRVEQGKEKAGDLQFRVMQDPIFEDGWDKVDNL